MSNSLSSADLSTLDELLKRFDNEGKFTRGEQQAMNLVMGLVAGAWHTAMYHESEAVASN